MTLCDAVAKRINNLLQEKNMSLYRLAKVSTIHAGTLNDLMYGKNRSVNLKTIYLIYKAFGMKAHEFFNDPVFDNDELEVD